METFYEYMREIEIAAEQAPAPVAQQQQQAQLPQQLAQAFGNLNPQQQGFLAQVWASVNPQQQQALLAQMQQGQQQPIAGQAPAAAVAAPAR